jgi:hypothetical protein
LDIAYRDKKQNRHIADDLEANTNMHREQHERLYAMAMQPVELVRADNTAAEEEVFSWQCCRWLEYGSRGHIGILTAL